MSSDTCPFKMSWSVAKQCSVLVTQCPENSWRVKPLPLPFLQQSSKVARRVSTEVPFRGADTYLHIPFKKWELDQTLIINIKELLLRPHYDYNLHLKLPCLLKSSTHSLVHLILLTTLRRMYHYYSIFLWWEKPGRRLSHLLGVRELRNGRSRLRTNPTSFEVCVLSTIHVVSQK